MSGNSKLGGPFITYVSTKGAASQGIYALVDLRGRGVADYAVLVAQNLLTTSKSLGSPNGIAWCVRLPRVATLCAASAPRPACPRPRRPPPHQNCRAQD